ncbi:MAG: CoA pyrophosphatase [Leptospiraceae bacterium]|nr:CoA pyrophosphatase [Leptospiraceae bacterium]MCP5493132.1 CoA pyrophosphatase [Leptospiraceae bacterium]
MLKISSIVVPIYVNHQGYDGIILTKRSDYLKSHPGQVSFPGGMYSPDEDKNLLETALREWEEETGESKSTLEVVGKYQEIAVRTGFHITPYIAVYKGGFSFPFNKEEVDFMFLLHLSDLEQMPFYKMPIQDRYYPEIYYLQHPRCLIWGATCQILIHFLKDFCGFQKEGISVKPNLMHPPFFDPNLL